MIKELKETISKEYGSKITHEFCLRDMVIYCLKGASKDKKLGKWLEQLGKESELLMKSMEVGSF